MIKVVHCKKEPYDVYVGREAKRFHFGNIASHLECSRALIKVDTREEAIEAFRQWLAGENYTDFDQERRQWILKNLHTLKDKTIACWCTPQDCHGRILKEFAERL